MPPTCHQLLLWVVLLFLLQGRDGVDAIIYTVPIDISLSAACGAAIYQASQQGSFVVEMVFSADVEDCSTPCLITFPYSFELRSGDGGSMLTLCTNNPPISPQAAIHMEGSSLKIDGFFYNGVAALVSYPDAGKRPTTILQNMHFGCDGTRAAPYVQNYVGSLEMTGVVFDNCGVTFGLSLVQCLSGATLFNGTGLTVGSPMRFLSSSGGSLQALFTDCFFPLPGYASSAAIYAFDVSTGSLSSFNNCVFGLNTSPYGGSPLPPLLSLTDAVVTLTQCEIWVWGALNVFNIEGASVLSLTSTTVHVGDIPAAAIEVFSQGAGVSSLFLEDVVVDVSTVMGRSRVIYMENAAIVSLRSVTVVFGMGSRVAEFVRADCVEVRASNFTRTGVGSDNFDQGCLLIGQAPTIKVIGSLFEGCVANMDTEGGALDFRSVTDLFIDDTTFRGCTGLSSGAVYVLNGIGSSNIYIRGSIFESNYAATAGNVASSVYLNLNSATVTLVDNNYINNESEIPEVSVLMTGSYSDYDSVVTRQFASATAVINLGTLATDPPSAALIGCPLVDGVYGIVSCTPVWGGIINSYSASIGPGCPLPSNNIGCPLPPLPPGDPLESCAGGSFSYTSSSASSTVTFPSTSSSTTSEAGISDSTSTSMSNSTAESTSHSSSGVVYGPTLPSEPPSPTSSEVDFLPAQCSEATSCFECATVGSDLECGWCESSSLCSSLEAFECEENEEPVKKCGKQGTNVGKAVGAAFGGIAAAGGLSFGFFVTWRLLRRRKRKAVLFDSQRATVINLPESLSEGSVPLQVIVESGRGGEDDTSAHPIPDVQETPGSTQGEVNDSKGVANEQAPTLMAPSSPSFPPPAPPPSTASTTEPLGDFATTRVDSHGMAPLPSSAAALDTVALAATIPTGGRLSIPAEQSADLDTLRNDRRPAASAFDKDSWMATQRLSDASVHLLLGSEAAGNDFKTTRG